MHGSEYSDAVWGGFGVQVAPIACVIVASVKTVLEGARGHPAHAIITAVSMTWEPGRQERK